MNWSGGKRDVLAIRAFFFRGAAGVRFVVRYVGFWTAILLPALYIPLVLIGNAWMVEAANLAKVLAVHAAFLFVGRGYADSARNV